MSKSKRWFAVLVSLFIVSIATALVTMCIPANVKAEQSNSTVYDWCIVDENSGIAYQDADGVLISAPAFLRKPLNARDLTLNIDFTSVRDYGAGADENIFYFVFSSVPKAANWDYLSSGDGIYVQLRSYAEGGMFISVDYVSAGEQISIVPFAGEGSQLGMDKTQLRSVAIESDEDGRAIVFYGTDAAVKRVDISAVPESCYSIAGAETQLSYFGVYNYCGANVSGTDRAFKFISADGVVSEREYPHTVFSVTDFQAPQPGEKTDRTEWVSADGNITETDTGVALSGNMLQYNFELTTSAITIFVDLSGFGETTYDKTAENLAYIGFTKTISSAPGYTLPGEGIWIVLRSYAGYLSVQVHKDGTMLLGGEIPSGATNLLADNLETVSFVRETSGYGLYLNSLRVNLSELDDLSEEDFSLNGKTRLSFCTYSTNNKGTIEINSISNDGKRELGDQYFSFEDEAITGPSNTVRTDEFIEVKDNSFDHITEDEKGLSVTGGGFYQYRLNSASRIRIYAEVLSLMESKDGEEALIYFCFTKKPTSAHYTYPEEGMYIMLRNIGGYLFVQVQVKTSAGNISIITDRTAAADTKLKIGEVSSLTLSPLDNSDTGFSLMLNNKKVMNNTALETLDRALIADEQGNTYFGIMTWSNMNLDADAERCVHLSDVENEGKTKFDASSYYYYDSGETIAAPTTTVTDEEFTFIRYSAYDEKNIDSRGITFAGGGYYNYKLKVANAGERVRVFLELPALAETQYGEDGMSYVKEALAYLCFTSMPSAAHYTYPVPGIYIMFRNSNGILRMQVQYKYEDQAGVMQTGTIYSESSALGNTGIAPTDLNSITLIKEGNGYRLMLNDKNIRADFSNIPDGLIADAEGYTYFGSFTWANPDTDPISERGLRLIEVDNAGKEPFIPNEPVYFTEKGEFLENPSTHATIEDFYFRPDMFYDVSEQADNGVRLSKPGYYNYALTTDEIIVFMTLDSLQETPSDRSQEGLVYLYFGSEPREASYDYQGRGMYIMLRNVNGYIVVQISYRTPAGNTNVLSETGLDAISPVRVEDLRYVRIVKAEQGFDIWLNNVQITNEKLLTIPHDIIEDNEGKTYFGFCTWSSPDNSPKKERLITINEVVNEGKIYLEENIATGCGGNLASATEFSFLLVFAVILVAVAKKNAAHR